MSDVAANWGNALKKMEQDSYALLKEKKITAEELKPYVIKAVLSMVDSLVQEGHSDEIVKWVGEAWGGPEDAHYWLLGVIKDLKR